MPNQSSNKQSRPFLDLGGKLTNKLRKTRKGGGRKSSHDVVKHGQTLLQQVEAFQKIIDDQTLNRSSDLPPLPNEVQVIIETDNLSPEKIKNLGLTFIEERDDGILVTVSPDTNLATLSKKTETYISEQTPSGKPKHENTIAPIKEIRYSKREDKIGDSLVEWINQGELHPDDSLWVDIELAGGRTEIGEENRIQFEKYIRELNKDIPLDSETVIATISVTIIEDDYSLHRVFLPGRAIEDLLTQSRANWILLIDLIPEIENDTIRLKKLKAASLMPLPIIAENAPRVVVIDSGIATGHPLFTDGGGQTIIGRQKNFLPDSLEPPDLTADEVDRGHGTAVASIVAYGSVKEFTLNQNPETYPVLWIENAKIMYPASKLNPAAPKDRAELHQSQHPKNLMRQVIAEFHQSMPNHCKIFNLCIGSAPHRLQQPISNWAEEIDNLSANNDILFIIAAGNLAITQISYLKDKVGVYPHYLLDLRARLLNPAQAYTALTVGAITDQNIIPAHYWKTDGKKSPFPPKHPAPFSRTGLLSNDVVKPDVVEIGGNLSYNNETEQYRFEVPELSIPVANRNFLVGQPNTLIGFQTGTSMATPKVSHLAGRIQAENPNASANLIRALIVNSAEWSDIFTLNQPKLGSTDTERIRNTLRLCGYGVPQANKALSANTHCMVFVTEDEFSWGAKDTTQGNKYRSKVSFFEVYLDEDALFGLPPGVNVRVSITLAYNPPVRKTRRKHYQGVKMYWELKRQNEYTEDFQKRWLEDSEVEENNNIDMENPLSNPSQWNLKLKPALNPGNKIRQGTVIRDWFDIRANELQTPLEIVVLATVSPWLVPPQSVTQSFALVVSVESLNQSVSIYDEVSISTRIKVRG